MKLEWFAAAVIYLSFFGLIGFAIWCTGSAVPLWALLITPSITIGESDKKTDQSTIE